jgi:small GTP-binding protein
MAANTIRKKHVFVGDAYCGKTCLLQTFVHGQFPTFYAPTIMPNTFDLKETNYDSTVVVDSEAIELGFTDSGGLSRCNRDIVRHHFAYRDTGFVVIGFAIDSPDSLENVPEKWLPEVQHFCPGCPIVLVGCKADLRYDPATIRKLKNQGQHPVTDDEALAVAAMIGAVEYVSCSAKTGYNVKEVFEVAARVALRGTKATKQTRDQKLEQILIQVVHNDKKETLVKKAKAMGMLGHSAMDALCLRLRKHESKHTAAAWIAALDQLEPACIVPESIAWCVANTLRGEYQTATGNGATAAEAAACLKSHVEAILCEPLQQLVDLDDPKRRAKELSSLTSKLLLPDWWYPAAVVKPMESV